MPKKDIDIIADELWWICKEYNGIPSQTVDKKAYSKALYILKTYCETPQIKAVVKEYNLSLKNYNKDKESRIAEVLAILEERKAMPHSSQEKVHRVTHYQIIPLVKNKLNGITLGCGKKRKYIWLLIMSNMFGNAMV